MDYTAAHFQTSDHVDLHYQMGKLCEGNAPAIFFCHGVGASYEQFNQQQEFAKEFCVVLPALRGHAASAMPAHNNAESMSLLRQALDMLELADHLKIQKFHFVGHSIGGLIGLEILKIAPDRLLSLTIFGVSPCPKQSILPDWVRANLSHFVSQQHLERFLGYVKSKDAAILKQFHQMVQSANRGAVRYMLKSMVRHDYLKTLQSNTAIPILLMRSEEDERVNEALDHCLKMLEQQRNIDIMRVGSASHLVNMEKPDFFNQILRAFLAKAMVKETSLLTSRPEFS